jgi:glycosyltransferase involved in cell wall biosynthesis
LKTVENGRASASRRIILINSFLNTGGSQQATIRLARQLKLRGHDAEAWFLYNKGEFYAPEIVGVETRILIDKPSLGVAEHARLFALLVRRFVADRPDAVVTFLPLAAVLGQFAALLAGVKARITSQRVPGDTYTPMLRRLDRLWGTFGIFKEVVCVSDAVRRSFDTYPAPYRGRLAVVHNGIEWRAAAVDRQSARARLGLAPDQFALLAVGRLQEQKNFGLAIEAAAKAGGVRLLIAGDGPDREALEARTRELGAADRTGFLGNQTPERIAELLAASDAFILPSLFEGQSNALLEAMHAGLPILASDIEMQRETLTEAGGGVAGFLLPLGSAAAWSEAIARLRDDPVLRRDLGGRAEALVRERFGLAAMVDKFEALILRHV